MIWLLAQIGLCLLLAALAGWYIGWNLRGFREQDRIEDLRQTMVATKDVQERESAEARREVDRLESKLARLGADAEARRDRPHPGPEASGPRGLTPGTRTRPASAPVIGLNDEPGDREGLRLASATDRAAPETAPERSDSEGARARTDDVAAAERARRREAEDALRRKTAAVLSLQAEIEALREAVHAKAEQIAALEARADDGIAARERDAAREDALERLQARIKAHEAQAEAAAVEEQRRSEEIQSLRKDLAVRDTRLNDLRNRCAQLETKVLEVESSVASGDDTHLARELAEVQQSLQRQIERNRKQDAVHRAVVAQFEAERERSRALRLNGGSQTAARGPDTPQRSDELTRIRGIGPAFAEHLRAEGVATFAQIANWSDTEIERIAKLLGTHGKRVHKDEWVAQARKLDRGR